MKSIYRKIKAVNSSNNRKVINTTCGKMWKFPNTTWRYI